MDVARRAGVSAKTVSRVVNEESYVSAATRLRVQEAIDDVGFRPNAAAKTLRLGNAVPLIGLVIEDLANPFYALITRAVEEVARSRGHALLVGSSEEDSTTERELIATFFGHQVSGLILVPTSEDQSFLASEVGLGVPIVFLDRPPSKVKSDCVLLDNVAGATEAVSYLLDRGHRRIGFVGDELSVYTSRKRREGYHRALRDHGISPLPELEKFGAHAAGRDEKDAAELLSLPEPVTAIFATNNRKCVGVLRAITKQRSNVAVVAFDDIELADLLAMPVALVTYDVAHLGKVAAELLFERLNGVTKPARRRVVSTHLVLYDSRQQT